MFPLKTQIDVKKTNDKNPTYIFSGELDETNADNVFNSIYEQLEKNWTQTIVFDMAKLTYLNSKSIGYITDIYSHTDNHGGKLILRNLTAEVYDILDIVGITTIVDIEGSPLDSSRC